jgi:hypothetical protein
MKMTADDMIMEAIDNDAQQRPPIVLTALDRDKLLALLDDAPVTMDMDTARFLREELERADIAPLDVAPNSVVRMGCEVKFVDHADARIRRATGFSRRGSKQPVYFSLNPYRKCTDRSLDLGSQSAGWKTVKSEALRFLKSVLARCSRKHAPRTPDTVV